jgi:hypothetical protein
LPSPTGRAESPSHSDDRSSFVKFFEPWNIPPTFAQYRSDLLASVCLTSGSHFLPIVKSLYHVNVLLVVIV